MKTLRNNVILIGNVGKDPEIITLDSGTKKVTFSLATNESYKDKDGNKVDDTQWHSLVAWNKTADLISQIVKKGDQIAIQGRIKTRSYIKDDETKYITEIEVNEFIVFTKKAEQ